MLYSKDDVRNRLELWEQRLKNHSLPLWDELPVFELYMDQVIVLVNNYLSILENNDEKVLTPSMINNYVKHKTIPAPVKKRYSRLHMAYLIMVCVLKQSLSISMIQKMIPITDEDSLKDIYNSFVGIESRTFSDVTAKVKKLCKEDELPDKLIMEMAVGTNVYNVIAQKLGER